ncbi:MAG: hypothetical protein K2W97_01710 [Chthoniobacterales bacterium]|nr:hypothetical protein [Chthoniobacterales bacterium]
MSQISGQGRSNRSDSITSMGSADSGFGVDDVKRQVGHMNGSTVAKGLANPKPSGFFGWLKSLLFGSGGNKPSDPLTMNLKPTSKEVLDGYAAKDQAYQNSKQQVVLHPTESSPEPRDLSPSYKSGLEGRTGVHDEPNAPQQKKHAEILDQLGLSPDEVAGYKEVIDIKIADKQQREAFDRFREANITLRNNPKPVDSLSSLSNIATRQDALSKQAAHDNALKEYKEALAGLDAVGLSYDSQTGKVSKKK